MIRKLMASSAVLALMSAGALTAAQAQDDPAKPAIVQQDAATAAQPATTELAASEKALTPDQPTLASVFIGKSVYASEDPESDNIGDINDLTVNEDGKITHAVVGVGGFLGIGEKNVAVPFDELKVVEKDGDIRLIYAATREQLDAAPALDRTAFDPIARYNEEHAAQVDNAAPGLAPTGGVAPAPQADQTAATEEQPAGTEAAPAAEEQTAATEEQPAGTEAAAPTEEQTAATEQQPTGEAAAPAAEEQTAATEQPAPAEEPTAASDNQAAAPAETPPADEQVASAETKPAASGEVTFLNFDPAQIRATAIIGKEVYGPDDQSIGEIADLIMQDDGKTRAALIDVGGFLGVGEKTVALPFNEIQVSQGTEGAAPKLVVAMSKDQLEQLPTFDTSALGTTSETTAMAVPPQSAEEVSIASQQSKVPAEKSADNADQMAAGTEPPAGNGEIVTGSVNSKAETYTLARQDIPVSKLMGVTVYGPDDTTLGEVGDVILDKEGTIQAVEIDVGGFLGFGEKPVAVGFDAVNVQTDANGSMLVMVNATKDQLDKAPTYEEPSSNEASVQ